MSNETESKAPIAEVLEKIVEDNSKPRINCDVCGSYVARMSLVLEGKKVNLCTQDAYTILRLGAQTNPKALKGMINFVEQQVYGRE